MLALGVRYLMDWAMAAADGAKKERAEWPPHPDRLFLALAAAWFETDEDEKEGAALRWLEAQSPPALAASDATVRRVAGDDRPVITYVPVNDTQRGKKLPDSTDLAKLRDGGLALLPEHRSRQPRSFPVAIPDDPVVHFVWENAEPGEHLPALESLVAKVVRLGHSASLVQVWVDPAPPAAPLRPSAGVTPFRLRISGRGRLDGLRARGNFGEAIRYADLAAAKRVAKGKERKTLEAALADRFPDGEPKIQRPEPGIWRGYAREPDTIDAPPPGSVFDPNLVVLALSGSKPPLRSTLRLTEAVRGTLLSAAPTDAPEWLTGHGSDGAPSKRPHLAIVPLPFVGSAHADGRVMGVALILPRALDPAEVERHLQPALWDRTTGELVTVSLFAGRSLEVSATLESRETPPASLRASAWTRPSKTWASVTPVVFDRHYEGPDKWSLAADGVRRACEHIGLPRPSNVVLHPVSLIEGSPHAREFPLVARKGGTGKLQHSHVVLIFDEPISGPVIVGAGRYRGYGLCRPIHTEARGD